MRCGMCLEEKECNKCNTCSGTFCKPCLHKWVDKDVKNNGLCTICKTESNNLKVYRPFKLISSFYTMFFTLFTAMMLFLLTTYIVCGYILYSCYMNNKCRTQISWYSVFFFIYFVFTIKVIVKCFYPTNVQPLQEPINV